MLTLNHAQMNEESGPDFSCPKSCPDAHSENPPAEDEKDACHMTVQSLRATPTSVFPPQALEKDFTLHSVNCFPQLK